MPASPEQGKQRPNIENRKYLDHRTFEDNMKRRSLAFTFSRLATTTLLAMILSLAGCASTPDEAEESDDAADSQSASTGSEFSQGETPVSSSQTRAAEGDSGSGPRGELNPVYFDFDRSNIRDNQRGVLSANSKSMITAKSGAVVAGHADERGSEEYNMALGQRRAERIVKYLESLGVSRDNMVARSYGEAMPAVQGHDESAWKWNRRAEIEWKN
jgi:peptidoglycan-associated lipoprotein